MFASEPPFVHTDKSNLFQYFTSLCRTLRVRICHGQIHHRKHPIFTDGVFSMVNLTTKQVETFFGELEYIEPRLKALGVIVGNEEVDHA